ncbi:hypothetical protein ACFO8Q_23000 [Effusibacillus consociatus]|uniref:Uncharacterized protein n=2 Tax=Effusibacillus consociatus TaxID=1117041 RepID=A0ABV9Q7F1_9BACL
MAHAHSGYPGFHLEKYEKLLRKRYPQEMIEFYRTKVEACIRLKQRKFYKEAARYARHIQRIYVDNLSKPEQGDHYLQELLTTYAKLPALCDELSALIEKRG